ncbi:hypothetical protein AX16_007726 [Volvariella volvacea WC 439]|nr:hypothetical protein AX16_007726 [Volvariella volvacea WC 439]
MSSLQTAVFISSSTSAPTTTSVTATPASITPGPTSGCVNGLPTLLPPVQSQSQQSIQLPPELYRGILQYTSPKDLSTLYALSLTCRDLGFEAERMLYRNLEVHHPYRQYLALRTLLKSGCKWRAKLVKTWKFEVGLMRWSETYCNSKEMYEGAEDESHCEEGARKRSESQEPNGDSGEENGQGGNRYRTRQEQRRSRLHRRYAGLIASTGSSSTLSSLASSPASSTGSSPATSPTTIQNPLHNLLLTAPMLTSPITHPNISPNSPSSASSPLGFPYTHPDAPIIEDITLMIQTLSQVLPYMTNLKEFVLRLGAYTNHVHCAMKLGQTLAECEEMRLERFIWDFWSDEEGVLEFLKRQIVVKRIETQPGSDSDALDLGTGVEGNVGEEQGSEGGAQEDGNGEQTPVQAQQQRRVSQSWERMEGGLVELGFQWSRPTTVARVWSSLNRNIGSSAATTPVVASSPEASSSSSPPPPTLTPLHLLFQNVKCFTGNMNSIRAFLPYHRNIQKLTWIADSHDHIESVMQRDLIPPAISQLIQKRVKCFVMDGVRKRLELNGGVTSHLGKVESLELVGWDPTETTAILSLQNLKQLTISTRKQGQFPSFPSSSLPSPASLSSLSISTSPITTTLNPNPAATATVAAAANTIIFNSQDQISLVRRLFSQHPGLEKVNIHIKYIECPSEWYRQWKRDMEDWEMPSVVHKSEIDWVE